MNDCFRCLMYEKRNRTGRYNTLENVQHGYIQLFCFALFVLFVCFSSAVKHMCTNIG
jgi:hypothetical protein